MRLHCLLAATALLASSVAAHADTFATFDVSGDFIYSGVPFSGSLTLDQTTGIVTNANLITYIAGTYSDITAQGCTGGYCFVDTERHINYPDYTSTSSLYVEIEGTSFVGLGLTDTEFVLYGGFATHDSHDNLENGLLVEQTITPEPSSFLLLGTGVLGIVGVMRKRFV